MALLALWPIVLFLAVILLVGWLVRRWNAREAERWRREIEQPTRPLRTLPPELLPPPSRTPSERTRSRR
jgi:hypothetical protein